MNEVGKVAHKGQNKINLSITKYTNLKQNTLIENTIQQW